MTAVPYPKLQNGQNGTIMRTILALETTKLCLVLLWHLRGGTSNHSGLVSRYQVPDPNHIHHISPHPNSRPSRATREGNRVTKCSKIVLGSLDSETFVVTLAARPQSAR